MEHVDVGYARRAHGIGGEVVVRPLTDDPNRWVPGAMIITDESPPRSLEVATSRPHHEDLLVRFVGIDDRDGAETLRGVRFRVDVSKRRRLDAGEYWPDELIGCRVVEVDGEALGTVVGIEFGAGQDRLVVETPGGSRVEVPLVGAIVPEVDVEAGTISVIPPDGLF